MKKYLLIVSLALAAFSPCVANERYGDAEAFVIEQKVKSGQPVVNKTLTLEEALELAFANNPSLLATVDALNESSWAVYGAGTNFKPKFDISAAHARTGKDISTDNDSTSLSVSMTLPLDINRRLRFATDMSRHAFEIDYQTLIYEARTLIYNVESSYFNFLRAKASLRTSESAVDVAKRRVVETEAKVKAGALPQFDLMSSRVDLESLNQKLIQSKTAVSLARIAFNNAMGIDVLSETDVENREVKLHNDAIDTQAALDMAYENSPLMKIANTAVLLADTKISFAEAQKKPSLAISAGYGRYLDPTIMTGSENEWKAGIVASMPIWDGGAIKSEIEQAKAVSNGARNSLDAVKLGVSSSVHKAVLEVNEAYVRTQTTSAAVALAEESLRLANVRYQNDISTLVELLNVESQLTNARFNDVNAYYDYAVAMAALKLATADQQEMNHVSFLMEDIISRGTK